MEGEPVEKSFKRYLVTAALPYANGKIHLGHLAGAYLPSDIYVRYQRSMKRDVLFICGSDEHGVAITITADQEKTTPKAVVDRYHALNKSAFEKFGMSFDNYSRTSEPLHHETSKEFFLKMFDAGILKEKSERQLYDEKAQMFLPDRYVEGTCPNCGNTEARGDQCENCGTFLDPLELKNPKSKISGETPAVRETTHWYFPLFTYQPRLENYIGRLENWRGHEPWKDNVLKYCGSWFRDGLRDRAVTRDLDWGVKVPVKGFEHKVLYVWFDAVLGYISGTKEWASNSGSPDKWKEYWLDPSTKYVAFIGKDNVVFHCIVFPAMLMAWNDNSSDNYILPENVPANEFLNFQGQKFSKSRGWGIDVNEFLDEFSPDTLRYALTMNLPELRDADFYWKDFQARTNNELADILGNFINRTMTFVHKNFGGKIPQPVDEKDFTPLDKKIVLQPTAAIREASRYFERYEFRNGALEIMNLARSANVYFDGSAPWKSVKEDPGQCATTLYVCLSTIRALAILLEPIIPFASGRIWNMLNLDGSPSDEGWESAGKLVLKPGHVLGQPEILFAKIEDEIIQKHVGNLPASQLPGSRRTADPPLAEKRLTSQEVVQANPRPRTSPEAVQTNLPVKDSPEKPRISIDNFKQIDLRVAKVLSAEKVPKSDKLLKLQVSIGSEQRQVVAGIAQHYKPEDLVGRKIIVVANLAPAKIMGQESQGMLLAASDQNGKLSFVTVESDLAEGSIVR